MVRGQRELLRITESILSTLDPPVLLGTIADRLGDLIGSDNVSIELIDQLAARAPVTDARRSAARSLSTGGAGLLPAPKPSSAPVVRSRYSSTPPGRCTSRPSPNIAVDDVGDPLDQVAVVAGDDHRARPGVEQVLQRGERVGVEVVGRLVEQQHVRLAGEQPQHLQPAALAAGEVARPASRPGGR